MRKDGRNPNQLRPISLTIGVQRFAEGSVLIEWGNTHVLCAASIEETVPEFRKASGGGWITAEYAMLPRATQNRKNRRQGGRETEIQRLIGRALRTSANLDALGPRTLWIDCDVLQADGGTRVASITGGYVALVLAIKNLLKRGSLTQSPLLEPVAAVSVGIVGGQPMLDLAYVEDSTAEVDLNLVMTQAGKYVEIQGTAEKEPFSHSQLLTLCDLGWQGIQALTRVQTQAIEASAKNETKVCFPSS